ncbi:non-homologous end-joining DNA ligase [Anaerosporomusa subterranea]|uniref:non-homologous end-joining DNA ligase n=1 Tax=Anaerosporomusa subterranea TaxID=1794912 RepID=UPI0008243B39|nr:non-homologous end-joining DNA ligase [Anaerosporomusa subterranea]
MPANSIITVQGVDLKLTNLDKVFYADGFTKGQVLDYYIRIAPVLLPHIADRPMSLKRYPHGAEGKFFYQKECPANRPQWFTTMPVWSDGRGKHINFCVIDSLPSLIWSANMAVLELHPSLSRITNISRPAVLVFDLDPGEPASMIECAEVGLLLRSVLAAYGLDSFPKTSGSKGLQVYAPLNTACDYEQTKSFAQQLAKALEASRPDLIVAKMRKELRVGKVFIDWSQNDEHKTTVSVYSLRAKARPTASAPVMWGEVEKVLKTRNPLLIDFTSQQVLDRVDKYGDLFSEVLTLQQKLPALDNKKVTTKEAATRRSNKRGYSYDEANAPNSLSALESNH